MTIKSAGGPASSPAPRPVERSEPAAPAAPARPAAPASPAGPSRRDEFVAGADPAAPAAPRARAGIQRSLPATPAAPAASAVPANPTTPDAPLLGDAMAAPHVGGDNTVGIGHDGTQTVRVGTGVERGLSATFEGELRGTQLSGQLSGGEFSSTSVTGTLGPEQPDGTSRLTLSLQNESGWQARVAGEAGPVGAEYQTRAGFRGNMSFGVDLQPGQVADITSGRAPMPNPLDPSSLPVGSRLSMRGEAFHEQNAGISYRGVSLTAGMESATGRGLAIERLDESRVRVTTGPYDRTTQSLAVGFERGGLKAQVGAERQLLTNDARSVEFDISTQAGRDAYQQFLQNGDMPQSGEGISGYQELRTITDQRQISASLGVAGLVGFEASASDGARLTERTTADGTEYTYSADWRGAPTEITWSRGADGQMEFGQFSIPVDERMARDLTERGAFRDTARAAMEQGVDLRTADYSLNLDAQGIQHVQDGFVSHHRTRAGDNPMYSDELRQMAADPNVTNDQWRQAVLDSLPAGYDTPRHTPSFSPLERGLFESQSPLQVANLLAQRHMLGTSHENLPGYLLQIAGNVPQFRDGLTIGIAPGQ